MNSRTLRRGNGECTEECYEWADRNGYSWDIKEDCKVCKKPLVYYREQEACAEPGLTWQQVNNLLKEKYDNCTTAELMGTLLPSPHINIDEDEESFDDDLGGIDDVESIDTPETDEVLAWLQQNWDENMTDTIGGLLTGTGVQTGPASPPGIFRPGVPNPQPGAGPMDVENPNTPGAVSGLTGTTGSGCGCQDKDQWYCDKKTCSWKKRRTPEEIAEWKAKNPLYDPMKKMMSALNCLCAQSKRSNYGKRNYKKRSTWKKKTYYTRRRGGSTVSTCRGSGPPTVSTGSTST